MLVILEGLVLSFWLLLVCVVGIAKDGPVGLVVFYEQEVKDRVVELGLTTKDKIRKISVISSAALFLPMLIVIPAVVYLYNGVNGFFDGFLQLTIIYLIAGLFDRIFIDWWWVGHTKAWIIPGTEEFMPYITKTESIFPPISGSSAQTSLSSSGAARRSYPFSPSWIQAGESQPRRKCCPASCGSGPGLPSAGRRGGYRHSWYS